MAVIVLPPTPSPLRHYLLYFPTYLVYIHIPVTSDTASGGVESSTQKKLAEERQTRPAGGRQSETRRRRGGETVGRKRETGLAAEWIKMKDKTERKGAIERGGVIIHQVFGSA